MPLYHLDYETASESDISSFGAYRYAADPSTRVLMFAISRDQESPLLWTFLDPNPAALELLWEAVESGSVLYAHNAQFEVAISHYRLLLDVGVTPPTLDQWRCTAAMCRVAAAPHSLAQAAEFFGLGNQKDPAGKDLIGIFSCLDSPTTLKPPVGAIDPDSQKLLKNGTLSKGKAPATRKSASPILDAEILWDWRVRVGGQDITVREAWTMFCNYCVKDVKVEQELHKKLHYFEMQGDILASFQFDMRMNFRGVPVNLAALKHAKQLVDEYQAKLGAEFTKLCGLGHNQNIAIVAYLKQHGYTEDNLQADTVEEWATNPEKQKLLTPRAREVLRLRALLSFAALKKIPAMIGAACPEDDRVRGTMMWYAARTGRAAGQIIQPQNMKKATISAAEAALCYRMVCEGWDLSWFELFWTSPLEAIASSIRHFIQPKEGMILDADYVGVEARIAPWGCGQEDKLADLVAGKDPYKMMASEVIYHIPYEQVTKAQRTVGKPVELQLGYGTGGRGLRDSLRDLFGVVLHPDPKEFLKECNRIVKDYRARYSKYPETWKAMEDAAKAAIRDGGVHWAADGKIGFTRIKTAGVVYLAMRLPSGRRLYYPHPEIRSVFKKYDEEEMEEDPWKYEKGGYWIEQISFYGKEQGVWRRIYTWGSKLWENFCQSVGVDLLVYGCLQAEKAGYDIFMIVHDQALAHDTLPIEGYLEHLCAKQPWAETFPLEADGAVHPYYLKED